MTDSRETSTRRRWERGDPELSERLLSEVKDSEVASVTMVTKNSLLQSLRSYPSAVFYMLGNEFCERFSFYGMKAILTLYLINEHHYKENQASLFYHAFVSLAFASPLLGSIAADNYFGRFRVIFWGSLIYVIGHVLLSLGAIPEFSYNVRSSLDFSGLFVIALATGAIKPCVSAFAADQRCVNGMFERGNEDNVAIVEFNEDQKAQRTQFFSFFYFAINAGSLVAILLTPMLRGRVKCFGSEYCFPLAFGVPGVLMLIAFLIFVAGWKRYKTASSASNNEVFHVIGCMFYAGKQKLIATYRKQDKAEHWIDYAASRYSHQLIVGVKSLTGVLVLFMPIIPFWALSDQQGSTWVLQARRMDGRIGPLTVLPDQMNTINPLIILIMVPIFEAYLYPLTRKMVHVTPLRKMGVGGVLIGISFVMAGILQLYVNGTMEPRPEPGHVFLQRFGNSTVKYYLNGVPLEFGKTDLEVGEYAVNAEDGSSFGISLTKSASGYVLGLFDSPDNKTEMALFQYSCEKSENGRTRLYLLVPEASALDGGMFYVVDYKGNIHKQITIASGNWVEIEPALISSPNYLLVFGESNCTLSTCKYRQKFFAQMGAAQVIHITEGLADVYTVVRPNSISILWQLPQFIVITVGEILFSISGLEFSYSQATPNMRSVMQAIWLTTVFLGNVIDMLISGSHVVAEPALEFFVYALLMVLVIGLFILFSMRYTYAEDRINITLNSVQNKPPIPLAKTDKNFHGLD
uniref:Peptide transporter 3 n=1 Tax=Syphacia muris TaxID=451379 RepID=A0A0N5AUQ9_9BILA